MTDPKRLRELPDLPVSLRDALRTLEQQAPAPETVARVQRALEALPAAGASAAFGFGWGAALFVATLGALGSSGWAFLSQRRDPGAFEAHAPQPTPTAAAAVSAAPTPASVTEAPQPVARALDSVPRRAAPEPALATSPGMPVRHDPARASRVRSRGANARADLAATGAPPSAATAALDTLAPAVVEAEPAAAENAIAEVNEPEARAPAKQALQVKPAPGPEPEDEAGLLYRAKRLARSDPAGALRLAESHANHFPQGAYVEEREVLAIELEHRLGHEVEAKQRAARFLTRFPRSAYRAAVRR